MLRVAEHKDRSIDLVPGSFSPGLVEAAEYLGEGRSATAYRSGETVLKVSKVATSLSKAQDMVGVLSSESGVISRYLREYMSPYLYLLSASSADPSSVHIVTAQPFFRRSNYPSLPKVTR